MWWQHHHTRPRCFLMRKAVLSPCISWGHCQGVSSLQRVYHVQRPTSGHNLHTPMQPGQKQVCYKKCNKVSTTPMGSQRQLFAVIARQCLGEPPITSIGDEERGHVDAAVWGWGCTRPVQ